MVYHQNVRGLRTKVHELYTSVLSEDYDIITLTETWLNDSFKNAELLDDRYNIARLDRTNGKTRGGGLLVAVTNKINMEIRDFNSNSEIECLVVKVRFKKEIFYIACVYVPPNTSCDSYVRFFEAMEEIVSENISILILGDFNIPSFVANNCDKSLLMNEFLSICNLNQCNTVINCMNRKLDLILSNMNVSECTKSNFPFVSEDLYHPALNVVIDVHCNSKECCKIQPTYTYDYAKGDYDLLYYLIASTNWSELQESNDVNAKVDHFYQRLFSCIDRAVPKKIIKTKSSNKRKYPVYFSVELIKNIREKNRLHRQVKRGRAGFKHKLEYQHLRKIVKAQTKRDYQKYHELIEINSNIDPNSFWKYVRSRGDSRGIPSEMRYNNVAVSEPNDIANAFAKYFESVYECSSAEKIFDYQGNFQFSLITEEVVMAAIKKLKPKKATGKDNIPAYLFKGYAEYLAKPLTSIFNLALEHNTFPSKLKESIVTPVFKCANKMNIENYRPISIINSLAKIFESILYDDIFENFKHLFAHQQHGFLPGRSTVTNLCILSNSITEALNSKIQLDVILTDCAKAFDKVDHSILLEKLGKSGFSLKTLLFINSYLECRYQQVKVGNCLSKPFLASSGVPQGSNLGPLFFTFFINDLPSCVMHSSSLIFADDFKIFKPIARPEDSLLLQEDLCSVAGWFESNKMTLNMDKCAIVTFTRKHSIYEHPYQLNNFELTRKCEFEDLGVHLQANFTFNNHYNVIVNKAYKMLGFVIRSTKFFKNISSLVKLYNALVRPHLEYAAVIWSPQAEVNINLIEKVQKRFLRFLYVRKNNAYPYMVSYKSMLDSFNMVTLEKRRHFQAVLFIYYIINNIKYKDLFLVNSIKILVPKINLRINSRKLFSVDKMDCSVINRMLKECNDFIEMSNIDLLNTDLKAIKATFIPNL